MNEEEDDDFGAILLRDAVFHANLFPQNWIVHLPQAQPGKDYKGKITQG